MGVYLWRSCGLPHVIRIRIETAVDDDRVCVDAKIIDAPRSEFFGIEVGVILANQAIRGKDLKNVVPAGAYQPLLLGKLLR